MSQIEAKISVSRSKYLDGVELKGVKLLFSANRCFAFDGGLEDRALFAVLAQLLRSKKSVAIGGCGRLTEHLLIFDPKLAQHISCIVSDDPKRVGQRFAGLPVVSVEKIPVDVKVVFHGETLTVPRLSLSKKIPRSVEQLDASILTELAVEKIPKRAWFSDPDCIYPIDIPEIKFDPGLDFILIDCPARNLSLMPNGLAYVHNALKKTDLRFQTVDLDIITYHRFHTHRILDAVGELKTPGGLPLHSDPWLAEAYDEWQNPDVIAYFEPLINEITEKLIAARPKVLGVSVQACNHKFTEEVVRRVKAAIPDTVILAGGYSCFQPSIGLRAFPLCDYMCIGEADLTIGNLVGRLAKGERPKDTPGIMSVNDTPGWIFEDKATMPMQLDELPMATYDWTDLKLYRNHNHYQLTPIIATRGCRWSKCTFCAERFYWRARDPKLVVDEFEYLHDQGCDLFMFNESDLNGRPDLLLAICKEIQQRKLKIKLTGQLRISRHSDRKFYDALRAGGFEALRFGVDAWSANTLKLQMKGYTVPMIEQNLRDCYQAGIYTEVNTVIGVPGETDQDIEETIELKALCKPWVGRVANLNALMLVIGSVYWEKPEKFNIKFRNDTKENIFARFPRYVPDEYWYSEDPYIDGEVRVQRYLRVVEGLKAAGYDVGPFAERAISKIEKTGKNQLDEGVLLEAAEDMQIFMKEEGAPAAEAPIRVSCVLPKEQKVELDPAIVVRKNSEFYGVFDVPQMKLPGLLPNIKRAGYRMLKSWVQPRSRYYGSDFDDLNFRVLDPKLTLNSNYHVEVRRDYGPMTRLIQSDVHNYNIVQVRTDFYGIKFGYEFDKERADRDRYPRGACFRGGSGRSVVEQIERYIGVQEVGANLPG